MRANSYANMQYEYMIGFPTHVNNGEIPGFIVLLSNSRDDIKELVVLVRFSISCTPYKQSVSKSWSTNLNLSFFLSDLVFTLLE